MRKYLYLLLLFSFSILANENEVEEAREGAPNHITDHASYMVWSEDKFITRIEGTNGFVCLVLRDAKGRFEPTCLNEPAMKSVFPVYSYQTLMLQKGISIQEIYKNIEAKHQSDEFPYPEPGALVYMMSPRNTFYDHFNERLVDVSPHVMLYIPKINNEKLGLNGKNGLPVYYDEYPHLGVIHINTSP